MISNSNQLTQIIIRKAKKNEIEYIRKIIIEAFEPYRKYYTVHAYRHAILLSPQEFEDRLKNPEQDVLVAIYKNEIIGTISLTYKEKKIFLQSMAVKPDYQSQGVGRNLLIEVEKLGKEKHFQKILLDTFDSLTKSQNLYEKFGYRLTGKKVFFHGVVFFEMTKRLI